MRGTMRHHKIDYQRKKGSRGKNGYLPLPFSHSKLLSLPGVKQWRLKGHRIQYYMPIRGLKVALCSHLDNPYWQSVALTGQETDPIFELKEKSQSDVAQANLLEGSLQGFADLSWIARTGTVRGWGGLGRDGSEATELQWESVKSRPKS